MMFVVLVLAFFVCFCAGEGCNMVELKCDRIKKASGCSLTKVLIDEAFLPIVKQVGARNGQMQYVGLLFRAARACVHVCASRCQAQSRLKLSQYHACAVNANVRLAVCSAFRSEADNIRVGGATTSNHLVGHALVSFAACRLRHSVCACVLISPQDMSPFGSDNTYCNWDCMLSVSQRSAIPG